MSDPSTPTPVQTPAPLARRLAALAYDLILLTAIWWCLGLLAVALADGEVVGPPYNRLLTLALAGSTYLYFVLSWTNGGQTVGMRSWRVVVRRSDGGPLDYGQASLRFACALLSLAIGGLGFAWSVVDRDRLALHDRLSGTRLLFPASLPQPAPGR